MRILCLFSDLGDLGLDTDLLWKNAEDESAGSPVNVSGR